MSVVHVRAGSHLHTTGGLHLSWCADLISRLLQLQLPPQLLRLQLQLQQLQARRAHDINSSSLIVDGDPSQQFQHSSALTSTSTGHLCRTLMIEGEHWGTDWWLLQWELNSCHGYDPVKSQQHFTNVLHYWYVTPFERFIHLHVTSRKDVSTDVRTTVNAAVNEFHWILTTGRPFSKCSPSVCCSAGTMVGNADRWLVFNVRLLL